MAVIRKLIKGLVCGFVAIAASLAFAVPAYGSGAYQVVYDGDSERLVSADDDFFSHFDVMMPGDVLSGTVDISNDGDSTQDAYFYTRPLDAANRAEADDLLNKIVLTISSENSGKLIYEGELRADDLSHAVHLGTFAPGDEDVLSFRLQVPAELGNEYAMAENAVNWVFATQEVTSGEESGSKAGSLRQTGDDTATVALAATSGILLASAFIFPYMRHRGRQVASE